MAIGDAIERIAALTHPPMREYASFCGADFVVIRERRLSALLPQPTFEKLQLHEILGQYERVVFFDSDVVLAPDAPDLFRIVPPGSFGAVSEEAYYDAPLHKRLTQEVLGEVAWTRPYFNSGVMVLSASHRSVFDPFHESLTKWVAGERGEHHSLSDQPYLNHRVNALNVPFIELGRGFNHTRAMGGCHQRFRSHVVHFAGPGGHRYGSKISQIRRDLTVFRSPSMLWVARRAPWLRWCLDRLDPAFAVYLLSKGLGTRSSRVPLRGHDRPPAL
jgi:hypothetical protein